MNSDMQGLVVEKWNSYYDNVIHSVAGNGNLVRLNLSDGQVIASNGYSDSLGAANLEYVLTLTYTEVKGGIIFV